MNFENEATQLQQLLQLKSAPIAIAFCSEPPAGVARVSSPAPSGCTYWKLAAEGNVFYTEPSDHFGCPVGSYTHNVALPPDKGKELEEMIGLMVGISYLRLDEVPSIPRREAPLAFVVYAPLADSPVKPDVVIVRGNAKQMMLLSEAANAAGVGSTIGIMGRPTCAMIPAAMSTSTSVMSLGCIGNRVYNELEDDEVYSSVSLDQFGPMLAKLEAIVNANSQLESFHAARRVR